MGKVGKGRVVSGILKHRVIIFPNVSTTRPTTDALKEALFNCLKHRFNLNFKEWLVIDAFAGSGALGIEAISLGAQLALFFEQNPVAYKTIRQNVLNLGIENKVFIFRADITKYKLTHIKNNSYNKILILMDPPYRKVDILQKLIDKFTNAFCESELIITLETNDVTVLENTHYEHIISASGNKKIVIYRFMPTEKK